MASRVDHFAALSRAVAGLDRDSYAARGAVYDREHKALLRHLFSANPPRSDVEIEQEQHAFRDAIRRIEFGDEEMEVPLVPQREPVAEAAHAALAPAHGESRGWPPPPPARQQKLASEDFQWPRQRTITPESAPVGALAEADQDPSEFPEHGEEPETTEADPAILRRRPVAGRVFGRALIGLFVLALGGIGYALLGRDGGGSNQAKAPAARSAVETPARAPFEIAPTVPQQVVLFDGNRPDPKAPRFPGSVTWRLGSEPTAQGAPAAVVQADLNVPGRKILMTMTIRREPPTSAMSHLFEFRFLRDDKQPDPDITNIASVVMTTAEITQPTILAGQVVSATPGVFLFGLSGDGSAREKNLRSLTELPWIALPFAYVNGVSGLLVIEKGTDGRRVIEAALRQWAQ